MDGSLYIFWVELKLVLIFFVEKVNFKLILGIFNFGLVFISF